MFPLIPENWQSLSAKELRSLAAEIRTAFEALGDDIDADTRKLALAAVESRKEIISVIAEKDALAAASMSADDEVDPQDAIDAAKALADQEAADKEAADKEAADKAAADAAEAAKDDDEDLSTKTPARTPASGTDLGSSSDSHGTPAVRPDQIFVSGGGSDNGDATFSGWGELAASLMEMGNNINPSSQVKHQVGHIRGNFTPEQQLGTNMVDNLRMFEPEVMAAFCAPPTPIYDMACWNTDRRPVRGSLPQFRPDARGSVSVFPSPSLADITDQDGGVGTWTSDDDDTIGGVDPSVKECAVISCGTPTVYEMYGVWRCLTIQNMLAMTFPELVEAWLNRLAAAHARLAETQLLEAMGTEAIAVTGESLAYGAAVSTSTQLLELLALHQEQERWDTGGMEGWIPRWVKSALKMDIMRRRNTSGIMQVPTDEAIDTMFRNVGVNPHWFIDTPTWAATVGAPQTAGAMGHVPDTIDILLAPRGKFGVIDRGQLNIGVTGNNIYRDNASNASNQFTMFFENFEGVVNTDSCPAYLLELPNLCYNGVQIADLEIACDGAAVAP